MPWWKITGQVKYSNFRIKKLALQTSPPKSSIQEQVTHYSKLFKEDNKSYLHTRIGTVYYNDKQYKKAIEFLLKGDKKRPNWWNAMIVARAHDSLYNYEDSVTFYELAFKRSRNNSYGKQLVNNNYAYFLATCPDEKIRNPEKALKLSLESQNGDKEKRFYFLGTLSCCYAATGNFEKALISIDKALKIVKLEEDRKKLLAKKELFKEKKMFINIPESKK